MFVTPQHQVKELRDEAGRNIVGGTMLSSELERMWGRYIEKGQRREEMGEEQDGGGGRQSVGGGGRKGKEGKGGMHNYAYICTSAVEFFDDS